MTIEDPIEYLHPHKNCLVNQREVGADTRNFKTALKYILRQALVSKAGSAGRVLCLEIMIPNPAIRNLIREDKVHQIYSSMQVGQAKYGMQTFNQSLAALVTKRQITQEEAFLRTSDADELKNIIASGAAAHLPGQQRAGG